MQPVAVGAHKSWGRVKEGGEGLKAREEGCIQRRGMQGKHVGKVLQVSIAVEYECYMVSLF